MLCVYIYSRSRSNLSLREDFVKEKGKSRSSLRSVPFVWLPKSNAHTQTNGLDLKSFLLRYQTLLFFDIFRVCLENEPFGRKTEINKIYRME